MILNDRGYIEKNIINIAYWGRQMTYTLRYIFFL